MTTFDITPEEWQVVADATLAVDPDETDRGHGLAVVVSGGRRWWLVWTGEITVETMTFDAADGVEMIVPVSRRLVTFGRSLSAGGDVRLTVGAGPTTVWGTGGSLRLDHPVQDVPQPVWGSGPAATATLTAHGLCGLFVVGRVLPTGVDLDTIAAPSFDVSITPTGVVADIDWSAAGVPSTRLEMTAATIGSATCAVWPGAPARLLAGTDGDAEVAVLMPASGDVVVVRTASWWASLPTHATRRTTPGHPITTVEEFLQLVLFDTAGYDAGFVDPYAGWSLTAIRALAIDPEPDTRIAATASRWNWDVRVQRVLATDPDERVVLALLDHVDPYVDVCELIIDGPHIEARRILAGRNLRTELLARLAADDDPATSVAATTALACRAQRVVEPEGAGR